MQVRPSALPVLHTIDDLWDRFRISRNRAYDYLNKPPGDPLRLEAMKLGRRTVVPDESVQRLVANLPKYAA